MAIEPERIILCMKWGDLYPGAYVNVLYNAVQANMPLQHRFVCLTNEPDGLHPDIEVFPIPDIGVPEKNWYQGAWPKVAVFLSDLYGLSGDCLFIDLDSVIVDDLSAFFGQSAQLTGLDGGDNWWPGAVDHAPMLGTGVFAFKVGELGHIADNFRQDRQALINTYKLEQAYVESEVKDLAFWPAEWVISFKRHLRRPVLQDRLLAPKAPPAGAKIVAFHGDPRPIDLIGASNDSWAKFPRYGKGPVSWMKSYWDRYSEQ